MLFGKAQLLKQCDDGLGILCNDQGIEACDFHGRTSRKKDFVRETDFILS